MNDFGVKEGIVRALTVKSAKTAMRPLLNEYRALLPLTNPEVFALRWALAHALKVVATADYCRDLLELVGRDDVGDFERAQLVLAIGRLKCTGAIPVLLRLLAMESVQGQVVTALGQLRAREARELIRPFLDHQTTWIRKEAAKAMARIDAS